MQKFTKNTCISDTRKKLGNSETFDSFLFCFIYVTFLSFESMCTENVNLKCNMSTDMYYFTFLSRKIEYILVNIRDILPVLFTKQTVKAKSRSHYPYTSLMDEDFSTGCQFNLTFKIIPFGSRASRFWLMSHNLRFKLYL